MNGCPTSASDAGISTSSITELHHKTPHLTRRRSGGEFSRVLFSSYVLWLQLQPTFGPQFFIVGFVVKKGSTRSRRTFQSNSSCCPVAVCLFSHKFSELIDITATHTPVMCSPMPAPISPHDGFLSGGGSNSNAGVSGNGSYRSCAAESSSATAATVSYSWSDFPILGQGSMSEVPPMVELDDLFENSCNSSNNSGDSICNATTCSTSDESFSRSSCVSIDSLEDEGVATKKKDDRKVAFSDVLTIRSYDVTLGDHPYCVGGMALTCDWTYASEDECIDLDVYERYAPKRQMRDLRLSYPERRRRLQVSTGRSCAELLQLEYELVCTEANPAPVRLLHQTGSFASFHHLSC